MLTTKDIGERIGVSKRHVCRLTKAAQARGDGWIDYQGERFVFQRKPGIGGRGWVYSYMPLPETTRKTPPKRRVPERTHINLNDLPEMKDFARPTAEEKLAVLRFCRNADVSYGRVALGLIHRHRAHDVKPDALTRKIKRWEKAWQTGGMPALRDKRGGRQEQVDMDLIEYAIRGAGSRHNTTVYQHYCRLWAEKHNATIDLARPTSDIGYSTFVRAAERLKAAKADLRGYLRDGLDYYSYLEPSFGRNWEHPNQQWEIDATKQDIMVKVPLRDKTAKHQGYRDYSVREATEDYQLVRMQIIGVIDNFTGATVYSLYATSNYYGNTRLIYKALQKLGRPAQIKGDNGADFVSDAFRHLLEDLQIDYIATGKGRGDQKGMIERSFRTLQHSPAFESLAGFVGHNVAQRQRLENQAVTKLERLRGAATNIKGSLMWWWEFENWLDNYMAHKQSERYAQHTPMAEAELTDTFRLLGKRHGRVVHKNGISHRKTHYLSTALWEHVQIGDRVQVIEHIDNTNRLFVFRDTHFICEVAEKGEFRTGMTLERATQSKKAYIQRNVAEVKSLTRQAQKGFDQTQVAVFERFNTLAENTQAARAMREDREKQAKEGKDAKQDYIRLMLAQVAG